MKRLIGRVGFDLFDQIFLALEFAFAGVLLGTEFHGFHDLRHGGFMKEQGHDPPAAFGQFVQLFAVQLILVFQQDRFFHSIVVFRDQFLLYADAFEGLFP